MPSYQPRVVVSCHWDLSSSQYIYCLWDLWGKCLLFSPWIHHGKRWTYCFIDFLCCFPTQGAVGDFVALTLKREPAIWTHSCSIKIVKRLVKALYKLLQEWHQTVLKVFVFLRFCHMLLYIIIWKRFCSLNSHWCHLIRKKKPKHVFYLDKPGDRIVHNSAPLFWAPIGQIWVFWTKLWQRNELLEKKKQITTAWLFTRENKRPIRKKVRLLVD